ncbi:hypothetical protein PILCRDRAFT_581034 [Piloderma croceum F 1598]|uniref:Intradiol ring-cleavage dioxygenases domain-containing protein n=1 Tax=Piloderma croceum (strain F 1598) TaxID=765440 RepID=A0A0C3FGJ2_PILCF|nr:hypothetical protein PILCRDRAFT_581034 [Piloderma croceum F 1598]
MLYQKFIATAAAFVVGLSVPTSAHPGEVEPILTSRQLELRQATANARHNVARKCDGAIKAFEARRRAKRSALTHKKHSTSRSTSESCAETASPSGTSTANAPTYTTLQNTTCVLTPEATEGPYFIHEELLRTDLTDGQDGLPLLLDIGVMDVTTCTPLENALVDVWHCNATGIYSGFIASEPSNVGTGNTTSLGTQTSMSSGSAMPSGTMSMGGGGGGSSVVTDQETFGRGAYPTNSNGLVEFSTIFPGFYGGRSVHIHTAVLTNYTTNVNGTIGQEAGSIRHIGQVFFEESWTEMVVATTPYSQETTMRTTNDEDSVYATENTAGYNATAQLSLLGDQLSDGLLGYVTLGVDPSASYTFVSTGYYTGDD